VRPRAHPISEVKVLTKKIVHQLVADGNCVVKRRGGEQPKAKESSVGDELDTAGASDQTASYVEVQICRRGRRLVGLRGSVQKRQREVFRWVETEGSEGWVREAGRPVWTDPGRRPTGVA
jgi:hypothetical protein